MKRYQEVIPLYRFGTIMTTLTTFDETEYYPSSLAMPCCSIDKKLHFFSLHSQLQAPVKHNIVLPLREYATH